MPGGFVHSLIKTRPADIVRYWSEREDECGLSVDWAEAHERCWRCGYKSKLERCHIVPDSLQGTDDPSNLVLLCTKCHREAPNVADPRFMWTWLRAHGTALYGTYWIDRGYHEFEFIFKRKPFSSLTDAEKDTAAVYELLGPHMKKCSWHFGDPRFNPSTIAWVLLQVENEIIAKR